MTNPTHPQWQHFESFHIIQQPSYASKYPPGQGAVLAVGESLAHQAIVGVWLLSAIAAAATYWMLLGWTTPTYAALGGLLWTAHPGFQLVWGQSYWGGTLAFIGGALVFGAALRMRRRERVLDAAAMANGAVVLAMSRPFEGLVFCVLIGAWLLTHWMRAGLPPMRTLMLKLVLPQAIVIGAGGLALSVYDASVTGSPLTMPYAVHEATYGQCPMFVGESPAPKPVYRHAAIEDFHSGWEMDWYRRQSTIRGWINSKIAVTWLAGGFLISPVMAAGLLLARPLRWARLRPVAIVGTLTFVASLAVTWNLPHYMAPFAPLLLVGSIAGLRRADALSRRRLAGFRMGSALVAFQVALFIVATVNHATTPNAGWWTERAAIEQQLAESPQRHVILVRYGAGHSPHQEWVYNSADIDGEQVVWARSMDVRRDAELLRYYSDRQAWLLEPEAHRLVPLPKNAATSLEALAASSGADAVRSESVAVATH